LLVLRADVRLAQSARDASTMVRDFAMTAGARKVWFEGHWGFQYYMQQWGAEPVDVNRSTLPKGDVLVLAWDNANISRIPGKSLRRIGRITDLPEYWIASLHLRLMAGFHSDLYGPLPFAFGKGGAERYDIYRLEHELNFQPEPELEPKPNQQIHRP
jgi:hypothetical protein